MSNLDHTPSLVKVCSACGCELPATAEFFARNKTGKYGLRERCKKCLRAYQTEYRLAHKEERRDYDQIRRATEGGKLSQQNRAWRLANKERKAANDRKWREDHPEERRAHMTARKARGHNSPGSFNGEFLRSLYSEQGGRCFYCDVVLNGEYDIDHFIPYKLGGSNEPENIRIACHRCNREKSSKHPMDFCGRLL